MKEYDHEYEGWTDDLLQWLLAWIDLIMEKEENQEAIKEIKK
jgi:hypothetical protein